MTDPQPPKPVRANENINRLLICAIIAYAATAAVGLLVHLLYSISILLFIAITAGLYWGWTRRRRTSKERSP